jgi:tetratricopeptide (TPR) repeat protein
MVMAKVSLRIYNREIERLIEQGHTDEAIAHCRHTLVTFPKHLETYRLLGKAYLESRRYTEAVDIFGRLLMAVPDDFVAHVGLSIIRDEENKLDDAIWHMERAFEAQPANAAIQGELQRLYGRRDGMEPPKIRMTRGALARIYIQGELYPQAVSEIRAVLAEDPQRSDMQVLLALSYFKSGQKSDASDICNQLLKRYPYCFDANRIMVELLPAAAGTAESTQVYRMRVGELDPYATFAKSSMFQSDNVPDASVNLERLEYSGEETSAGQDWDSSLGIGLGEASALTASSLGDQPDWLKSSGLGDETPQASPEPVSMPQANDDIPDFLRAAGWGESNTPEQPTSIFDEEPAGDDLVPADLPDWLKDQAPEADAGAGATEPHAEEAQSIETPDWLSGLGGADETPGAESVSSSDTPDWLTGLGGAQPVTETPETPSLDDAQPVDVPDWLKDAEPKSEPAASVESLGTTSQEQDDAVAWLESLAAKHGAKPEELVTDPNKRSETPPEWVSQAQHIGEQPPAQSNVQDLGATSQEQDDAVAWLESLAAKHGAKPEELVTDPNKRSETPPEWVQQAQSIGEAQSAEEPAKSDWVEGAQNVGEQFFAEFENLPAPSTDETGMWLRDLGDKEKQDDLTPAETFEEQSLEKGDIPDWLSDTPQPAAEGPKEQFEFPQQEPAEDKTDLPDWLSDLDDQAPEKEASLEGQVLENQDLSGWLSGLDEEPGLDLDPELIRASQRPPFPSPSEQPAEESEKSDLPGWLSGADSEQEAEDDSWKESIASTPTDEPVSSTEETPVTLTADLPDWLKGVDEESAEIEQGDEAAPPWLHRDQLEAESTPQQPKPTTPSDWHPVVEKADAVQPEAQTRTAQQMEKPPSPEPVPVEKKKAPAKPARQRKPEGAQSSVGLLSQAEAELERGDIPTALLHYGKLIKKGRHLEETISDLTDSLYRYPVEVGIWQALGDAYMRANRLKEALDAYNKAEELIR